MPILLSFLSEIMRIELLIQDGRALTATRKNKTKVLISRVTHLNMRGHSSSDLCTAYPASRKMGRLPVDSHRHFVPRRRPRPGTVRLHIRSSHVDRLCGRSLHRTYVLQILQTPHVESARATKKGKLWYKLQSGNDNSRATNKTVMIYFHYALTDLSI